MGRITSRTALAVFTSVVLLVSLVVTSNRHWLLKVPKVGFILYAIAGGSVPPYFDDSVFEPQFQTSWARPGDIFIASSGKSGSTWLSQIMHEIRTKGNPGEVRDIYECVRLPEVVYYPGQTTKERTEILRNSSLNFPFAIYKTHLKPPKLQIRTDAKYIILVRKIEDVVASLKPFLYNHNPDFAKLWGGFPPQAGQSPTEEDSEAYAHYVLEDMGGGKGQMAVFLEEFLLGWWPHRHDENVMFVHYNDLVKDLRGEVLRLATFAGVSLSEHELDLILSHSSFEFMKKNSSKFNIRHLGDDFKAKGLIPMNIFMLDGELLQLGPSRSGERELDPDLLSKIRARTTRVFGDELSNWIMKGGAVPV